MKIYYYFLLLFPVLLLSSCNTDEGLGGSSSLEGYVYNVVHSDDNFSFATNIFPALDEDVFLEFGDDQSVGERIRSGRDGYYRFDYLRKGDYTVFALSSYVDGHKDAVVKKVKVSGGTNKADTIFIHTGKAAGTAMVQGSVYAWYYHNGSYRDKGPGTGMRAYIKHAGEVGYFDDVRVADGSFIFQKIQPGDYEVAVETEDPSTERVTLVIKTITVTEIYKIHEIPETFEVDVAV